ncbi:putative reverse transcriptase zinc-binding domain-containing protein [Helianthus annuus]|nr:putative reverse transcriptase zinc-binding domain-containing protein [Helianthus annuus]
MRRDFLWGGDEGKQKMTWVAWKKTVASKEGGGLGFGLLRDVNIAMLAKWWWRFKSESNVLWKGVIWSIHNNPRAWNAIPAKVSVVGPWKQIFKIASDLADVGIDFQNSFRGIVGCGHGISFWLDRWVANEPLASKFPRLFAIESNKRAVVSDRVKGAAGFSFQWVRQLNSDLEHAEFNQMLGLLFSVVTTNAADKWEWSLAGDGLFSVSRLRRQIVLNHESSSVSSFSWNRWTPLKVNFLMWRLNLDKLPTRMSLVRRGVNVVSTLCEFCQEEEETTEHVFCSCRFTQKVWEGVSRWCKLPAIYFFGLEDLAK